MPALDRCLEKRALCEKFLVPVPGGFFYRAVVHEPIRRRIVRLGVRHLRATHRFRAKQKDRLKVKERERSHRRYAAKEGRKLGAKTRIERRPRTRYQPNSEGDSLPLVSSALRRIAQICVISSQNSARESVQYYTDNTSEITVIVGNAAPL